MPTFFVRTYDLFSEFLQRVLTDSSLLLVQVNIDREVWRQVSRQGYVFLRDLWKWLKSDMNRWTVGELYYFRDIVDKILKGKEEEVKKLHVRFHYPSFRLPFRGAFPSIDIETLLRYDPAKKKRFWKNIRRQINDIFESRREGPPQRTLRDRLDLYLSRRLGH